MKKLLPLVTFALLAGFLHPAKAQNTSLVWAKKVGSTGADVLQDEMRTDANYNLYIRINLVNNADLDPGPGVVVATPGFYLIKYDSAGNYLWNIPCPGRFTTDRNGNSYIAGRFNSSYDFDPGPGISNINSPYNDLCIAKYSTGGALVGITDLRPVDNATSFQVSNIVVDEKGDPYITGVLTGSIDFDPSAGTNLLQGNGNDNYYLAAYTTAGGYKWAFKVDVQNVNLDLPKVNFGNGSVYMFGLVSGTSDLDPAAPVQSVPGNTKGANSFVARYNRDNGSYMWSWGFENTAYYNRSNRLSADSLGNILVSGYYGGPIDLDPGAGTSTVSGSGEYLAKYTGDGVYLWGQHVAPSGYTAFSPFTLNVDPQNNILLSGADYVADSFKIVIIKYDPSGAESWNFNLSHYGGHDYASGLITDGSGNFYISGVFDGTLDFDPEAATNSLTALGSQDGYFAKYKDNTSTVPIKLLSFTGEARGKQNLLHWTTAMEQNSMGFDIERKSPSGAFTRIGFVKSSAFNGNSNSNLSYEFYDGTYSGDANYYRLKQMDKDGNYSYSKTLLVRNHGLSLAAATIYPNPVNGVLNLKLSSTDAAALNMVVTDMSGKTVLRKLTKTTAGSNLVPMDVSTLPAGIYYLKLAGGPGNEAVLKFEKK